MKKSFRIYYVTHDDGRRTGFLMRLWSVWLDRPLPCAYGLDEEDVASQLEAQIREAEAANKDKIARYLWDETFTVRSAALDIHPQSVVDKRGVIGKRTIPLRVSYAVSQMADGAYRVVLPRFDWWFVLEDLDTAGEVLRTAISGALLGDRQRWVYEFRQEGEEYIREWSPAFLLSRNDQQDDKESEDFPIAQTVADELVDRARRHKLPPIVGGADVADLDDSLLERAPPASLVLVGPTGVGKTTWVMALARQLLRRGIEEREPPPRIWSTSRDRLLAGMIYLGQWQERCLGLVEELAFEGDYLYLDRLTDLVAPFPDGSSLAEVFRAGLENDEISLIVECTEEELEQCRRRMPGFLDHFTVLRLREPTQQQTTELLLHQAKRRLDATIPAAGMKRLVRHLAGLRRDIAFPGKGFRFLEWLQREEVTKTLYPAQMSATYAKWSGLPEELISDEHRVGSDTIAAQLGRKVIGQPRACEVCGRLLARFKAGLNDPERPAGSLFFVGPTGVGKTELAKQLAIYLFGGSGRMVRLDMSEYAAPGAAARLLDASSGSASLAERVREQPLTVVLLDEVEKAHPEVFDLLLGALGEGRLTDDLGRLVDFSMVVFVMTSNLGADQARSIGFDETGTRPYESAVRRHFRPEFFNRIDSVVGFTPLALQDVERIVDLQLASIRDRAGFKKRNIRLSVAPDARRRLAELGYDRDRGARPLKRVLEAKVITPIAVRLAERPELSNLQVPVLVDNDEIVVRI